MYCICCGLGRFACTVRGHTPGCCGCCGRSIVCRGPTFTACIVVVRACLGAAFDVTGFPTEGPVGLTAISWDCVVTLLPGSLLAMTFGVSNWAGASGAMVAIPGSVRGTGSGRLTKWRFSIISPKRFWCVWKCTSRRCSMYLSGFLFIRTAPNHESMRGPEFLTPSRISQGDISRLSWTLRP